MAAEEPEIEGLLASYADLLEAMRRLTSLAGRLLERAATGEPLTADEQRDAHQEIDATRVALERLEAMLILRRQQLRLM